MPVPFLLSREERLMKKIEKYIDRAGKMRLKGEKEEIRGIFLEVVEEVETLLPHITKKGEFSALLANVARELIGIDYNLGMRAVNQAIQLNSLNIRAYTAAASLNLWNRVYGKALEWVEKALEISSSDREALEIKANILESLGDIQKAIEIYRILAKMYPQNLIYFDKILKYYPDDCEALYSKGLALYEMKKYPEAAALFKKVITVDRNSVNAWIYLGICYDKTGKYEDAIVSFSEAVKLKPEEKAGWINLGIEYTKLGKYEEAVRAFSEALLRDPTDVKLRLKRARIYTTIGNYKQALEDLDTVLTYEPENLEALMLKKNILKNTNRFEELVNVCDKILSITPGDLSALYDKAYALYNLKRYLEAVGILEEMLKRDQLTLNGLYLLLNVYKEINAPEKIVEISDRILYNRPDDWSVWVEKGRAKNKLKLHLDALHCFDMALKYTKSVEILKEKLETLKILNRVDDIIETARKIIDQTPEDYSVWQDLGQAYFTKGLYEEALNALKKSLQLKEDAESYNIIGIIKYKNGDFEDALKNFTRASELDPSKKKYWVNITQTLIKLGRKNEAISSIEKAIDIEPSDYYLWFLRAKILNSLERYEEALHSITKSLEFKSENLESLRLKAEILFRLGRYEEALAQIEELLKIRSDDELYYLKSQILYKSGRLEEALNAINNAIQIRESIDYFNFKKMILIDMNRSEELISVCRKLIELKPTEYENYKILGKKLMELGRQEEAEIIYNTAKETFPNNLEVLEDIRIFYSNTGNFSRLIEVCNRILDINKNSVEALIDRGRAYMYIGELSKALEDLEAAYSITKSSTVSYYLGEVYEKLAKYQDAIKHYNQAYRKEKNSLYLYKVAENQYRLKEYEGALKTLDKIMKMESKKEFVILKSKILYELGRYAEAYSILENVDDAEAKFLKAKCLFEMGRYEEAIDIVCEENNYDSLKLCGDCLEKVNRLEEAYKTYVRAESYKSTQEIHERIGRVALKLGKYDTAISAYQNVVSVDPNNKDVWLSLGLAFEKMGDRENAIRCYEMVISLDPKEKYAWTAKGKLMLEKRNYEEALRCFERALQIDGAFLEAIEGKKSAEKAMEELKIEEYSKKVLKYEYESGKRLTKKDMFTRLKIPLSWVDKVYEHVRREYEVDLDNLSSDEFENLEKNSIEIIKQLGDKISLPAIIAKNPHLTVSDAKKLLSYIRKVLTMDVHVDSINENLEEKLRVLLSSDKKEFSIYDVVELLNVGIYEAKIILSALKRLEEEDFAEKDSLNDAIELASEKVKRPRSEINMERKEDINDEI